MTGRKHSEETKKKISDANSRPNIKLRGKHKSQEHCEKLRCAWIERRKRGVSDLTREKLRNINIGRKHSPETKEKMRANHWSRKTKGEEQNAY